MGFVPVTAQEERLFRALWGALATEGEGLEPEQWLAAVAHLLGHIVAHQDEKKFTLDAIVQMIVMNVREVAPSRTPRRWYITKCLMIALHYSIRCRRYLSNVPRRLRIRKKMSIKISLYVSLSRCSMATC